MILEIAATLRGLRQSAVAVEWQALVREAMVDAEVLRDAIIACIASEVQRKNSSPKKAQERLVAAYPVSIPRLCTATNCSFQCDQSDNRIKSLWRLCSKPPTAL